MKRVRLPLDHLAELWPNDMKGARIGALLHPASVSASLRHTSQILEELSGQLFRLAAFFGPQHGFLGQTQENMVEWTSYRHPRLGIPIYSLYGETRQPTAEMLRPGCFSGRSAGYRRALLHVRVDDVSLPRRVRTGWVTCVRAGPA